MRHWKVVVLISLLLTLCFAAGCASNQKQIAKEDPMPTSIWRGEYFEDDYLTALTKRQDLAEATIYDCEVETRKCSRISVIPIGSKELFVAIPLASRLYNFVLSFPSARRDHWRIPMAFSIEQPLYDYENDEGELIKVWRIRNLWQEFDIEQIPFTENAIVIFCDERGCNMQQAQVTFPDNYGKLYE